MADDPISYEPHIILCEGDGDQSFFKKLIEQRGLPPFTVLTPGLDPGGVEGYQGRLEGLKFEVRNRAQGILVVGDNDRDPKSAFGNIRAKIERAGDFGVPNHPLVPARSGNGYPPLVVLMIPWTDQIGQLETLCLQAMYAEYPKLAQCVDRFSECCGASSTWKPGKLEKMKTRAMLTANCEQDPNTSLRHAWSRTVDLVPLRHQCFNQIAEFLAGFPTFIRTAT